MAGSHRSVSGEHAELANLLEVCGRWIVGVFGQFAQELDNEQSCVAFVHMKFADRGVSQCIQHADAADSQHHLLREPIGSVSAVEIRGQSAVIGRVGRQIAVKKKNRQVVAVIAMHLQLPCLYVDSAFFYINTDLRPHFFHNILGVPLHRLLGLVALLIQLLEEISLVVEKSDSNYRHAQFCI
ncbi:Uncharacterised protein [uncultured archaeon]|nr:Uncharacterised protein [uncultured archaeon]